MSARKRSSHNFDLQDAPTISLKLSDSDCIHGVARDVLNVLSSCARGLPVNADQWDLSLLLVEGLPVRRQTVLSWLDKAYMCTYGQPFVDEEAEQTQQQQHKKPRTVQQPSGSGEQQQQGDPPAQQPAQQQAVQQGGEGAAAEQQQETAVSQYDTHKGHTLVELTQLLLFADAVGSTPPLLQACASDLGQLRLRVLLPEGLAVPGVRRCLDIQLDALASWGPKARFSQFLPRSPPDSVSYPRAAFPAIQAAVTEQVQQQVEALLYAAYKLQLSPLAELLEGFIRRQVLAASSILRGQLRPIMSERVTAAAAGFKQLQESLLLQRWCTSACSLAPHNGTSMVAAAAPGEEKFSFPVVLLQDFLGLPRGCRVDAELDLLKGIFSVGGAHHLSQLLLGPSHSSAAERQALLGPSPLCDVRQAWATGGGQNLPDEEEEDDIGA